jgi:uncharacterized phage-associated protein
MNQQEIVLAALAPAKGASHSPVQVQKLLFLIDRNIPSVIEGPLFNFQPYNYGPFDKTVYDILDQLALEGYADIIPEQTWRSYKLTAKGQLEGDRLLQGFPNFAIEYINEISNFVRKLSFTQLVSAIYRAYPEMRANSVFQG